MYSSDARSKGQPWPLPFNTGEEKRNESWRFSVLAQRALEDPLVGRAHVGNQQAAPSNQEKTGKSGSIATYRHRPD